MSRFATSLALGCGLTLVVGACNRSPPEPLPSSTTGTTGTTGLVPPTAEVSPRPAPAVKTIGSGAGAGANARCIDPTPQVAPPIPPPAGAACPVDPEPGKKLLVAEVVIPDAAGAPRVNAELALTPAQIERGLMYRRTMADDAGMLFHLDGHRVQTFWMHNTCIALDMLFIDDDGLIVGIVEGAAPLTDTIRKVACPSSYVLEVNGGWARKHGVRAGQTVLLPPAAR